MFEPTNHLEMLKQTFHAMGISYRETRRQGPGSWRRSLPTYYPNSPELTAIEINDGSDYPTFGAIFFFDDNGTFIVHALPSVWEKAVEVIRDL